jgi:cell wall-associated NlpC family hydrolase
LLSLLVIAAPGLGWTQLRPGQHQELVDTVRNLARHKIDYNENWRPPGSRERWQMDCSNTTRYIYKTLFNIHLPRNASGQFVHLHKQGRITRAPKRADGSIDTDRLLGLLRSGDLLFWEWTYKIKRNPPVSHVMIYLGRTAKGEPKMAGSSSGGFGEVPGRGGVDVYTFDPNGPCGGVKNFWGKIIKRGRFVGFGRPIVQPPPRPAIVISALPKADPYRISQR